MIISEHHNNSVQIRYNRCKFAHNSEFIEPKSRIHIRNREKHRHNRNSKNFPIITTAENIEPRREGPEKSHQRIESYSADVIFVLIFFDFFIGSFAKRNVSFDSDEHSECRRQHKIEKKCEFHR